jgi:uncharacterized membrane protein (DUF4010 family)
MASGIDLLLARDFAFAMLIGALIGLEREKRKTLERDGSIGGIRTFILFAQTGAMAAWLAVRLDAPWIFAAGALGVTALVMAGYVVQVRTGVASIGLTTEVAAVVTFLLGGVCLAGQPALAVGLGIVTSAVLAWKQPIHGVIEKIDTEDLYAGLKLAIASFVVLPLLPREAIDPWGALAPYELWLLVVLISALSLVGYVSVRWLGPGRGTIVTGLFGGLVSSTAVTLTFARKSLERSTSASVLASGLLVAWTVMFGRVVVEVLAVHAPLLGALVAPLGVMAVATLGCAVWFYLRPGASRAEASEGVDVPLKNPFSLRAAITFALFFALVLLGVAVARQYLPASGLYAVAALAGLTDVDAITMSMAAYARDGGEPATAMAMACIILAVLTNTVVKASMAAALGAAALRSRVVLATVIVVAAGLLALAAA